LAADLLAECPDFVRQSAKFCIQIRLGRKVFHTRRRTGNTVPTHTPPRCTEKAFFAPPLNGPAIYARRARIVTDLDDLLFAKVDSGAPRLNAPAGPSDETWKIEI